MRAALRFLAENCDQYAIDTNHIVLMGSSAGSFIGLHHAYMDENERPAETFGIPGENQDLGCADCSGNNAYNNQYVRPMAVINRWGAMGDTNWIEPTLRDSIPLISFHGTNDNVVPFGTGYPFSIPLFPPVYGSSVIHERLENLGVHNQFIPLQGAGHEPELLQPRWDDTIFKYTTPFLYDMLKPDAPEITGALTACQGETVMYPISYDLSTELCLKFRRNLLSQDSNIQVQWSDTASQENNLGSPLAMIRLLSVSSAPTPRRRNTIRAMTDCFCSFQTFKTQSLRVHGILETMTAVVVPTPTSIPRHRPLRCHLTLTNGYCSIQYDTTSFQTWSKVASMRQL